MEHTLTLKIGQPIQKIEVAKAAENIGNELVNNKQHLEAEHETTEHVDTKPNLNEQKLQLLQICRTLNHLVDKLNRSYDELLSEHREEIAKLSVEIARKILFQKVQNRDYRIEAIVKETLKNVPSHKGLVVRLNPNDYAEWQKLQEDSDSCVVEGINAVPDSAIGAAECIVESSKGAIKSIIEEHLERISKALESVE